MILELNETLIEGAERNDQPKPEGANRQASSMCLLFYRENYQISFLNDKMLC